MADQSDPKISSRCLATLRCHCKPHPGRRATAAWRAQRTVDGSYLAAHGLRLVALPASTRCGRRRQTAMVIAQLCIGEVSPPRQATRTIHGNLKFAQFVCKVTARSLRMRPSSTSLSVRLQSQQWLQLCLGLGKLAGVVELLKRLAGCRHRCTIATPRRCSVNALEAGSHAAIVAANLGLWAPTWMPLLLMRR